jgi:hypothetical protein
MPRCLLVLAAFLCVVAFTEEAAAQVSVPDRASLVMVKASASLTPTGVVGVVTDEAGQGIDGASILAMGATLVIVRTDARGRFALGLAPGPYILRATRDGYISTYREAVHVRSDAPLTRAITLLRTDHASEDVALASTTQPIATPSESLPTEVPRAAPEAPSEMGWRLRHLPRTALRDESLVSSWIDQPDPLPITRPVSLLADLNGRLDVLATGAVPASGASTTDQWPRSVAYMVLGAPVGRHGDWSVRASFGGGETAAWTMAGEFATRTDRPNTFRVGVSYAEQTLSDPSMRHTLAAIDTVRRVGGVHLSDHWSLPGGFAIDSGFRVDRYEYLADPTLLGGRLEVTKQMFGRVSLVAAAAPHMVAPGADQFAAPAADGVWLPAERTFSSLDAGRPLAAQRVESYEAGADAILLRGDDGGADLNLRLRRFRERTVGQMATVFGLDDASQVGHYYIASPGSVELDGWLIGVSGELAPGFVATIDYAATSAMWHRGESRMALRRAVRSAARSGAEQLHDVTATLDARVPLTDTRVSVALRVNSGFSHPFATVPGIGSRFAVEVRQLLPVRVLGHGELNLLLSARTLVHHLDEGGGFYDELLTVAPPVRLTCGIQVRF